MLFNWTNVLGTPTFCAACLSFDFIDHRQQSIAHHSVPSINLTSKSIQFVFPYKLR